MSKELDLKDILARNPQIDPNRLERTAELLNRLAKMGLRRKEYNLAFPFENWHPREKIHSGGHVHAESMTSIQDSH